STELVAIGIAHIGAVGGGARLGTRAGSAFTAAAIGEGIGMEAVDCGTAGGPEADGAAIGVGGGFAVDRQGNHEFGGFPAIHRGTGTELGEPLDIESAEGGVVERPGPVDIAGANHHMIENRHSLYSLLFRSID